MLFPIYDVAVGGERLLQHIFSGVEGKISHKQFGAHAMICRSIPTNFVCSRPPGFKSSLNQVHLKIHHVRKVNYLTGGKILLIGSQMASGFTTIKPTRQNLFQSHEKSGLFNLSSNCASAAGKANCMSSFCPTHFTAAQSSGCGSPERILQMKNFRWTDFSG